MCNSFVHIMRFLIAILLIALTYVPSAAVSQTMTDVREVVATGAASCLITTTGVVRCWGRNTFGILGTDSIEGTATPFAVTGLPSDVKQVVIGNTQMCAVTTAGTVWCWGFFYGFRPPTAPPSPMAYEIPGFSNNTQQLVWHTESNSVLALLKSGAVVCVSTQCSGGVASGSTVAGLTSGVTEVWDGCALQVDSLKCWGNNERGQLGDGTTTSREFAAPVLGIAGPLKKFIRGSQFKCVVHGAALRLSCWGSNDEGRLGVASGTTQPIPASPDGLEQGVTALAMGYSNGCATVAGVMYCWGQVSELMTAFGLQGFGTVPPTRVNRFSGVRELVRTNGGYCVLHSSGITCGGSRGYSGTEATYTPAGLPATIDSLVAGPCVQSEGATYCWEIPPGDGTPAFSSRVLKSNDDRSWSRLFPSLEGFCVNSASATGCWGSNFSGQFGDDPGYNRGQLAPIPGLPEGSLTQFSAAKWSTCALSGTLGWCWTRTQGVDADGNGITPIAMQREPFLDDFDKISPTWLGHCGLKQGQVYCWNFAMNGDLTYSGPTPVAVKGLPGPASDLATGLFHACAIVAERTYCWGDNDYLLLGRPGPGSATPVEVPHTGSALAIYAAQSHTCVRLASGVQCWGGNQSGQLGARNAPDGSPPRWVEGFFGKTDDLALGASFTCALRLGRVACVGRPPLPINLQGMSTTLAMSIDGLDSDVTNVAAAGSTLCALRQGKIYCIGDNRFGQLGVAGGVYTPQARPLATVPWSGLVTASNPSQIQRNTLFSVDVSMATAHDIRVTDQATVVAVQFVETDGTVVGTEHCEIPPGSARCWVQFQYSGASSRLTIRANSLSGVLLPAAPDVVLRVRDRAHGTMTFPVTPTIRQTDPTQVTAMVTRPDGSPADENGVVVVALNATTCDFLQPEVACSLVPAVSGSVYATAFYGGSELLDQSDVDGVGRTISIASGCVINLSGGSTRDAMSDGLLVVRWLLGLRGASLVRGVTSPAGAPLASAPIELRLSRMVGAGLLDLDLSGQTEAATDGALLLRALFGFKGASLVSGLITGSSQRTDPGAILNYLQSQCLDTAPN